MALHRNCGIDVAAESAVMIFLTLVSAAAALYGHVDMVNAFRTPTQFTCHPDVTTRQTYTAAVGEIYNFAFNTDLQQFWDCRVDNGVRSVSKTIRVWGDDGHGGPQLWGCFDYFWRVHEELLVWLTLDFVFPLGGRAIVVATLDEIEISVTLD